MKKTILSILLLAPALLFAQEKDYQKEINSFRKKYIESHGAVKDSDRKEIRFFPPDETYRVIAKFVRIEESPWFGITTSSGSKKPYRVYGSLHFTIKDTALTLYIYESQDLMQTARFRDYLFVPFTDLTNGEESYEAGRYIDIKKSELSTDSYILDFNKAYNPYCAYGSGKYNCPIPPKENNLPIPIEAGEMKFADH